MRLLQFTDTHLPGSPGQQVRGVGTAATLARCLAHAKQRHPMPRALLLTGDLVHDDAGGYDVLQSLFGGSAVPVHCLPGNHDRPDELRQHLARAPFVHDLATRYDGWLIVMLDSTVAGKDHGHMTDAALERLDGALAGAADAHALICLHHHPVPLGSRWLDELMVDNADRFFAVLARHERVRGIAWGHAHQAYDGAHGRIRLMGTPSTCMQFAEGSAEFRIDTRPPAYRWLQLGKDGKLETGIEWVPDDD